MTGSKDMPADTRAYFPRQLFEAQFCATPQYPPKGTDLRNHVAIITGSNTGLGYESARQLLALQLSHLVIAVRSISKGEAAATRLRQQYPKATIEVRPLDMSDYSSIQAFVRNIQDLPRIDYVILNSGLIGQTFQANSSTGHEETFQVNYLSTVLLAMLLLPELKARNRGAGSKPPIMTLVNSGLSTAARFKHSKASPLVPSFDDPKNFDMDRYNVTKLLAHMWLWKLAEYVSAEDVIVSLVDPSYVKGTELHRDAGGAVSTCLMSPHTGSPS